MTLAHWIGDYFWKFSRENFLRMGGEAIQKKL